MFTAFVTKYNGEVLTLENLSYEELDELKNNPHPDYVDIEVSDSYTEEDEELSPETLVHFL